MCHGAGYVRLDVPLDHPDFGKLLPCPRCRLPELQAQHSLTKRALGNLQLLERFTFETFKPEGIGLPDDLRRNLRSAYERAMAYAERPEGWLLLKGGYGCGKTHLAAAIANAVAARGEDVLFVTVPDLLDHLRAAFAPGAAERYDERFEQVKKAPLLVLDDLGTEHVTQWALEKLFQLLNYRYLAQLPTVITTNYDLEDMEARLRSRLADPDLVEMVTIRAPDFRLSGPEERSDLNALPLYREMRFETFDLRRGELAGEEAANLQAAWETALAYAERPEGWLVLTGDYGCGKTHLAAAIANVRRERGDEVLFVTVPDLLDHLRATYSPQSTVSYDKRFEEVRRAKFLVLDDLGTESATAWAQEKLYQLINYRYLTKLPTVITTAKPIGDLPPRLRSRILSAGRSEVFAILAPPYYGRKKRGKKSSRRRQTTEQEELNL